MGSYASEQRKVLEQLIGRDANKIRSRSAQGYKHRDLGLYDTRICKSYLVGECPHDLFQGTKNSIGRCPQIHLTKHKLQYEREKKRGKRFPEFEKEYYVILQKFVKDCNGQIAVALKKLEHTPEERAKIQEVTGELDVLDARISLMIQEIESLLKANEVSQAIKQGIKIQELQAKRVDVGKKVKNMTESVGQSAQQKLQVCEVCGAYLSRLDTDRRLADHFMGKIHLGYVKMRRELDRLDQRFK
ncbi:LUC7 (YDL087C) [Zygosaccharomyces parabailii]|nr:LUC7 (YDL087C) [Zygosaccharomyces parabailii]CDH13075.1 probable protein LUC7 [Zygosaccharomyces bailii ISA1307]